MMNKYLEINFSVDRLKVGIYYMCRRLFDKIESTETGIIFCVKQGRPTTRIELGIHFDAISILMLSAVLLSIL